MNHKLSIITPCYNCQATLQEAVASVFTQELKIPFEIVMVDDGSTDGTKELIRELAGKYPEIKYFFHEKNRGGGAARNTGIKNSSGDLIFCLDSDDILPPAMLPRLLDFLEQKNSSGVLFQESRFFTGKNKKITGRGFNEISDQSWELADLFNSRTGALTTVNFLFTKEAYLTAGGYPEHHGFDTQGFGFKFLSRGLEVFTCPQTYYYHRQAGQKSYFSRVYESGELSLGSYFILEEIMHLFSPEARREIINYDVFENSKLGEKNLKAELDRKYTADISALFLKDYRNYRDATGYGRYVEEKKVGADPNEKFVRAVYLYKNRAYKKALDLFVEMLSQGISSKLVYFNILRCAQALSGGDINSVERETIKLAGSFGLKRQKINLNPNLIKKIVIKLWLFYKKICEKK